MMTMDMLERDKLLLLYFVRYDTNNDPLVLFFTIGGFLDEVASVKLNLQGGFF